MSILVTDRGFATDDWRFGFHDTEGVAATIATTPNALALDIANDFDVIALAPLLDQIDMIRLDFPVFSDGRGFSQARRLRLMGFQGRLRASGPLLSDQYAMARRCGFDEVEIPDEMAARQPEEHWLAHNDWREHDYQTRLRQFA
jgi:uncharacterized protein (DUF934 family)